MNFFHLSTTGDLEDEELVLLEDAPLGLGMKSYCMARGVPAAPHYPADPKIFLRDENPGIKLSSLLGNTKSYLVASSGLKETIAAHCSGLEIEYLPFVLYDHRKRVFSRDYFIINPIGAYDCLDERASGVEYGKQGSVIRIERYVLDPAKMSAAPSLFRVDKEVTDYIIDERLARAIEGGKFTNIFMERLAFST